MEEFVNTPINTLTLPKFEEAQLSPLQAGYWKIILINIAVVFLIIGMAAGTALYFINEIQPYWPVILIVYCCILLFIIFISRIDFKNRGFAFRTHDMIYKSGAIALTTTMVPYNRVQHVALHEGFISRKLGLASVEIFTAGGNSSDVKVPGIEKSQAERIKQLLMGKILKEETNEE